MRRRAVEIEVVLLDVFAVVSLRPRYPEEPFFDHPVVAVPQRQREADALLAVADAAEPVFVPPVGARARLLVCEVVPGVTVRAVVLAHRAPGAFAQVRTPPLPRCAPLGRFLEASVFWFHLRCGVRGV